jgi:hypothetical protein
MELRRAMEPATGRLKITADAPFTHARNDELGTNFEDLEL